MRYPSGHGLSSHLLTMGFSGRPPEALAGQPGSELLPLLLPPRHPPPIAVPRLGLPGRPCCSWSALHLTIAPFQLRVAVSTSRVDWDWGWGWGTGHPSPHKTAPTAALQPSATPLTTIACSWLLILFHVLLLVL